MLQTGWLETYEVQDSLIDSLYEHGSVDNPLPILFSTNQYLIIRSEISDQKTALVRYFDRRLIKIGGKKTQEVFGIRPKDAKQTALLDALMSPDVLVNVALGSAGTGKTTLALAYSLFRYEGQQQRIILTKPATFVGNARAFGPVPGTGPEKYAPFLDSYKIVLRKLIPRDGDVYLKLMQDKGYLEFMPIEYMRGCTLDNASVVIDEAQNLTWHELNTIVSRVGDKSKVILLGDLNQIDVKMRQADCGLYKFCTSETFSNSPISSVVTLTEQYRSRIAQLANDVDNELRNERDRE